MLNARRLYADKDKAVIVVESVDIRCENAETAVGFLALSRPVAVVTSTVDGTCAVDLDSQSVNLERLLAEAGQLRPLLFD